MVGSRRLCWLGLLVPALWMPPAPAAAPAPQVRELRTQKVGDVTYFHVRLEPPKDLLPAGDNQVPRLVPQDGRARAVYGRGRPNGREMPERPADAPDGRPAAPRQPVPVEGLEFVGQIRGDGPAPFLLIYPTESRRGRLRDRLGIPSRRNEPQVSWVEVAVTLDFGPAVKVAVPAEARERQEPPKPPRRTRTEVDAVQRPAEGPGQPDRVEFRPRQVPDGPPAYQPPVRDDLQGLWAAAQVEALVTLDEQATDFSFYAFAAQATGRKYGVPVRPGNRWRFARGPGLEREVFDAQLYETTTGAAAITESLQLRRLLGQGRTDDDKRSIPIAKVEGIDIAEHPWQEMMGDRKPAPEPLARLVPADNYFVHFKSIRKFIEFSELLDQWGTDLIRAYEVHSRDHRLKERYERQLCLKSTWLGKTLGPAVIRGIALTGSDLYLREGSDVAAIFHVANRGLFLAAVEPFVAEARTAFGDRLKEGKADYQGVTMDSFVTPQREVSLHRAAVGDYVIYANSPVGLRRILDAHLGRAKALADSLDYQYVRTVFRHDDPAEDGFAFLSDPFIRTLVGPASKIKEKRRLEALTSLSMLTNGALFAAWETGAVPAERAALLAAAGLQADALAVPEGPAPVWDAKHQVAVAEAYNTMHFATPLAELPIENVTPQEAADYRRFRGEYLGLWRRYFDPIGMRFAITDQQVKIDTYILPLIQNSQYNELRRVTGDGTVALDARAFAPATLLQFLMHLSPAVGDRRELLFNPFGFAGGGPRANGEIDLAELIAWGLDPVGKWFFVRFDESPVYAQLAEIALGERGEVEAEKIARMVFQIPVVVGMDVKNPVVFAGAVAALRLSVMKSLPGALTWEPMEPAYKGISIVRVQATPAGLRRESPGLAGKPEPFLPAVYYAMIDGAFYLTLNEQALRTVIDQAEARKEGKGDLVEVNTSLYLAPAAAEKTRDLLHRLLERQVHGQALGNLPIWYALDHAGLIPADAAPEKRQATAFQFFGFVPVSPDGAAYAYAAREDEVTNARHGSARRPQEHRTLAADAPLNRLLEQLRTLRADLRFREDGVHTVLTVERTPPQP